MKISKEDLDEFSDWLDTQYDWEKYCIEDPTGYLDANLDIYEIQRGDFSIVNQDVCEDETFVDYLSEFRRWKREQTSTRLVIEVPNNQVTEIKTWLKKHNVKVKT